MQVARSAGQLASVSSSKPAGLAGGYVSLKICADWKRPRCSGVLPGGAGVSVLPGYGSDHCWLLPPFSTLLMIVAPLAVLDPESSITIGVVSVGDNTLPGASGNV